MTAFVDLSNGDKMPIFTARENFKPEYIKGYRRCESCHMSLQGKTGLVVRWQNKRDKNASLALCDDECWQIYDHNFWLERAAKKKFMGDKEDECDELLGMRVETK